jgi:hypothetical protein
MLIEIYMARKVPFTYRKISQKEGEDKVTERSDSKTIL